MLSFVRVLSSCVHLRHDYVLDDALDCCNNLVYRSLILAYACYIFCCFSLSSVASSLILATN